MFLTWLKIQKVPSPPKNYISWSWRIRHKSCKLNRYHGEAGFGVYGCARGSSWVVSKGVGARGGGVRVESCTRGWGT